MGKPDGSGNFSAVAASELGLCLLEIERVGPGFQRGVSGLENNGTARVRSWPGHGPADPAGASA